MPGSRLTWEERHEVFRLRREGFSVRATAQFLGRAPSTISRELRRDTGVGYYSVWRAQGHAKRLARRPKPFLLEGNGPLAREVGRLLGRKWSPEQISARLRRDHPGDPRWSVAPETIYASLFVHDRGGLADELRTQLRSGQTKRSSGKRGGIPDKTMIWDRPEEARDRAVPGHWEGDLILPADGRSAIATLVERSSRFTLLVGLPHGRTAEAVRTALAQAVASLPPQLWRSLTWDQGNEMAEHARFTIDTGVKVYFCQARHPWQRGTNENTNRLIRQYYPKATDFRTVTQAELDQVAEELNSRPRKTLGWDTPAETLDRFLQAVATTT